MALKGVKQSKEHIEKRRQKLLGKAPRPAGFKHSEETRRKMSENKKGRGVYLWLRQRFGEATYCQNSRCRKTSESYDYTLLKGKAYIENRDNFVMLCLHCHKKYTSSKIIK